MKFHFGTNHHSSSSHHYHSGGGNDRGSSDYSGLAVMMVPAHPSSVLFMDAHPDNAATASEEGQSSLQSFTAQAAMSSSEEYRQEEPSSSTTGGGTPNDEPAENDHTLEIPQRSSSKSRQFFRIKGRRSRSSSPVTTDCPSSCSSPGQQHHRQEMIDEHQHHCQQHRLNVMDLLRPARLRRSTSLPHTIATAATTSTNTASTSTTTSSNHSSATTSNKSRHKRCVTFTNIQIREYNTILGDHPCCQSGPPLALGWEFNTQDEVVIDIDDYENKFIDNNNHCPCNDHHESGNDTSLQQVRRRSMNELRLNCEDRREILCGLMKPVEEDLTTTTTTTMAVSSSTMMMMEEDDDGSNENQPQLLQSHQNDSHQQILQPSHTSTTTTTSTSTTVCSTTQSSSSPPTPLLPLYTKEELRKAERKLERERRCNSGNAARTRRRLKRGFFMPLTPEEEESYKLNSSGGSLIGNDNDDDDEHLDYSSSSEDENGVVSMDISPKKEVSQKNSIM